MTLPCDIILRVFSKFQPDSMLIGKSLITLMALHQQCFIDSAYLFFWEKFKHYLVISKHTEHNVDK